MTYYTASSVIAALTSHPDLSVDNTHPAFPFPVPSCPKPNDPDAHCEKDFPNCEGKTLECHQKLRLKTRNGGNPIIVSLFYYFIDKDKRRDGRIKKENATIRLIKLRYGLDENALCEITMD